MSGSAEAYYGTPKPLTESKGEGKPVDDTPHEEGNRKTRRKMAKARRKAARQAIKVLRGGIGNSLISVPMVSDHA